MVWLQSGLLYLHVLGAIFWFGSALTFEFVILPALLRLNPDGRATFLDSVAAGYGKVIPIVAASVIALGILRGLAGGVLGSLNTAYGITWLVAIPAGILVMAVGAVLVGPTTVKLRAAATEPEFQSHARALKGYGRLGTGGMVVMLGLMMAMRAGY